MPENQKWLGRSANKMDAHCKACQTDILSRLASLKQHANISKFAQSMLILPVSNASCERIFSQINLIKTKNQNRFKNVNVSHILHVKQSLRENGCNNFKPNEQMLCKDLNYVKISFKQL